MDKSTEQPGKNPLENLGLEEIELCILAEARELNISFDTIWGVLTFLSYRKHKRKKMLAWLMDRRENNVPTSDQQVLERLKKIL